MHVRAYDEADLERLRAIHAGQGFSYEFPELRNPLFLTKLVLCDGEGGEACEKGRGQVDHDDAGQALREGSGQGIIGASLLRLTAETYLLLDTKRGTPRERWEWILALHAATEREAARAGRCARVVAAGNCGEIRKAADEAGLGSG